MTLAMLAKVAASVTDLKKDPRGTYVKAGDISIIAGWFWCLM